MLPGPVFNVELVTSARRVRYYLFRVLFCLILLFLIWTNYDSFFRHVQSIDGRYELDRMARFAEAMFWTFIVTEAILVLLLTPALVAGTIAEEKQRRTLHYLLASQLTSAEIVLGKLFGRLLHVGIYLLLGLPIFSLLTLFGGVAPELILLSFLGLISTIWFLGCLAMVASTVARRTREAISTAYLLVIAWLFLPTIIEFFPVMPAPMPAIYGWIGWANEWIAATSPFYLLMAITGAPFRGGGTEVDAFFWFCGLQFAGGALMIAYAIARLRPIFRAQEGGRRPFLGRFRRAKVAADGSKPVGWNFRIFPRRPLRDDPMMWKEMQTTRTAGFAKLTAALVGLFAIAGILWALIYTSEDVFRELSQYGYGYRQEANASAPVGSYVLAPEGFRAREELNGVLRFITTLAYVFLGLAVAARAAGSITGEKEQDTWISLLATDLTPWEVVRAKLVGTVWGVILIPAGIILLWLYGVATGAVHPAGFLLNLVQMAIFLWFIAALGVHWSLYAKSTIRAVSATVFTLLMVNVGYLLFCIPFEPNSTLVLMGMAPAQLVYGTMTYREWHSLLNAGAAYPHARSDYANGELVVLWILGLGLYAIAAVWLTLRSVAHFDRVAERPRRAEGYVPRPVPAGKPLTEPIDWEFGDEVPPVRT